MAASGANFMNSVNHPLAGEWSLTGGAGFASPIREPQTAGAGAGAGVPLKGIRDPRSVLHNLQSELERSTQEMNAAASLTGPLSAVDRPRTKHTMSRSPSTAQDMLTRARARGPRPAEPPRGALTFPQVGTSNTRGYEDDGGGARAITVKALTCTNIDFPM